MMPLKSFKVKRKRYSVSNTVERVVISIGDCFEHPDFGYLKLMDVQKYEGIHAAYVVLADLNKETRKFQEVYTTHPHFEKPFLQMWFLDINTGRLIKD